GGREGRTAAWCGDVAERRRPRRKDAEAVATADGERPERRDGAEDDVALLAERGAEVQAGRAVGDDPCLQLAVGLGLAHPYARGACAEVPVDEASVVTGLVRACPG